MSAVAMEGCWVPTMADWWAPMMARARANLMGAQKDCLMADCLAQKRVVKRVG
jgi:hypothetical protein